MVTEDMRPLSLELLSKLAKCPAVSFYEGAVAEFIGQYLEQLEVSFKEDAYGNLVVRRAGEDPELPAIAFMAHMDHPGFEAFHAEGTTVLARALGGVPSSCFSERVPVQIVAPDGQMFRAETSGRHGPESERAVSLHLKDEHPLDLPCAVVFDLPDFSFDGELVHMRALDDLGGCASMLVALTRLVSQRTPGDIYFVFTRAEEVGLVGARLLAQERRLPMSTLVISVETSRTLPGAALGEGPVIRVGDASFTFDIEAEGVLISAREQLRERNPEYKVQRQLMSGGTCEASAFAVYGYRVTGIALPLGNYHNAGTQESVEAEYIHLDDFLAAVELIVESAHSVGKRRDGPAWRRLQEIPENHRARLMETAHPS